MTEVRFYHLTTRPLESVLPVMLERHLARGGTAVVRGTDRGRLDHLDRHLWTYDEASFLPHAMAGTAEPQGQPVWLTDRADMANGARTLFLIDRAETGPSELADLDLAAILFDGNDPAAVDHARGQWRAITDAGLKAVYWAQNDQGGWEKRAESDPSSA